MKRVWIAAIPFITVLGLLAFSTGYIANPMIFFYRPVEEWISPAKNEKVIMETRYDYPLNELLDPSGWARFELKNTEGKLISSYEVQLFELDDSSNANVEWIDGIPTLFVGKYGWPVGTNGLKLKE